MLDDVKFRAASVRGGCKSLLAVVMIGAFGAGGLGAETAAAELNCTGKSIKGPVAFMQKSAQQEVWASNFASEICNKGSHPTVTTFSTGSDAAMKEWNYDGERGALNLSYGFIGTSMAPTTAQIEKIKSVAGGAKVVVVPVAQTAIAIIANPPAGCGIEAITNNDLASTFSGVNTSWSQLESTEGGASCEAPITRVVRKDPAGSTYQFKNYLYQLDQKGLFCTEGGTEGKASWEELESVANGKTGTPNTVWPKSCGEKTLSEVVTPTGTGDPQVVQKVNATSGSIGYTALPSAKAGKAALILKLQNNGLKPAPEGTFGNPAAGTNANCSTVQYNVPAEAGEGLDIDWSPVFGAQPSIGGTAYPLCGLIYMIALHGYEAAGFSLETELTVHDYLAEYIVKEAGQKAVENNYYYSLTSAGGEKHNVLEAASKAAAKITP